MSTVTNRVAVMHGVNLDTLGRRDPAIYGSETLNQLEARVHDFARELGFSFDELAEAAPTRKRATSAPKYRHPENAEITWSGRGRKPAWIAEALASGKSLDDFAI